MNKDQIKKALDSFENDKFVDAKDVLKKEIGDRRDAFVKDKLGLQKEIDKGSGDKETE